MKTARVSASSRASWTLKEQVTYDRERITSLDWEGYPILRFDEIPRVETLLLGVSAGVGEELAMRGALQPRFGLIGTSLLFAVLHVQYSPIGILTIAALGMLLGLIRKRTSTSTAIAVHVLYDIVAALGIQHG